MALREQLNAARTYIQAQLLPGEGAELTEMEIRDIARKVRHFVIREVFVELERKVQVNYYQSSDECDAYTTFSPTMGSERFYVHVYLANNRTAYKITQTVIHELAHAADWLKNWEPVIVTTTTRSGKTRSVFDRVNSDCYKHTEETRTVTTRTRRGVVTTKTVFHDHSEKWYKEVRRCLEKFQLKEHHVPKPDF